MNFNRFEEGLGNQSAKPETPTIRLERFLAEQSVTANQELLGMQKDVQPAGQVSIGNDFRLIPPPAQYSAAQQSDLEALMKANAPTDGGKVIPKEEQERMAGGPVFEKLCTAILYKQLREHFIIARTSKYDDWINGVDHILVDKKTGHVLCAIDEIAPANSVMTKDERFQDKKQKVAERNFGIQHRGDNVINTGEFGAKVDFGIKLEGGNVSCVPMDHIPVIMLALNLDFLNRGVDAFLPEPDKASAYEDKLFQYFMMSITQAIQEIRLNGDYSKLPEDMRTRLKDLQAKVDGILAEARSK